MDDPRRMRPVTLQDAWSEMADGLQIQRYFLEVEPALTQRLDARFAARGGDPATMSALRDALSDGLLEHLLDDRQPLAIERAGDLRRFAEMASTLAGAAIVTVPASACVDGAAPLIDLRRLPSAATAHAPAFADAVAAVLDITSTTYFLRLNTRVIVQFDREPPDADAVGRDGALLETIAVAATSEPYTYAEDVAARSAARLGYGFVLSRPDPTLPPPAPAPAPWSETDRDRLSVLTEIVARSVRLRMRTRILELAPELLGEREREACRSSIPLLRRQLLELAPLVDDLERLLAEPADAPDPADNNADVADFVCTLFPGPNQFHKYLRGGCAGQAEV